MAQLVEQRIRNAQVVGSSPTISSKSTSTACAFFVAQLDDEADRSQCEMKGSRREKKQGAGRSAPNENCDYVSGGSATDS